MSEKQLLSVFDGCVVTPRSLTYQDQGFSASQWKKQILRDGTAVRKVSADPNHASFTPSRQRDEDASDKDVVFTMHSSSEDE